MLSQFIHLLTSTIYPSFPLVFSNNFPILGQANYSPSLYNTEAAYAAEKFGDTGNAQLLVPKSLLQNPWS